MTGKKILVVEDDESFGQLLIEVLTATGHYPRLATTNREALAAVEEEAPDVICLDIDLPDGTGWALLDELDRRHLPVGQVIVATAGIDAARSRTRPGAFLLPKPFPIESLLRLVDGDNLPEI